MPEFLVVIFLLKFSSFECRAAHLEVMFFCSHLLTNANGVHCSEYLGSPKFICRNFTSYVMVSIVKRLGRIRSRGSLMNGDLCPANRAPLFFCHICYSEKTHLEPGRATDIQACWPGGVSDSCWC